MENKNQERYEVIKTEYRFLHPEDIIDSKEFFDRFKTWEEIRAERYLC